MKEHMIQVVIVKSWLNTGHLHIHVINFKEASGRFFFHFPEVFQKCIEYIRYMLTSLRQRSFCYRVIDQWNRLPEDIVNAKTVISFKTLLDKHFIQHRFDISEIY